MMQPLSRRRLLGTAAATATLTAPAAAQPAPAQPAKPPKRATLSVNMRSDEQRVVQVPELTTYMSTLPLETGATAIRVGLANTTSVDYRVAGICVTEAAEWLPDGRLPWSYLSFSKDGVTTPRPAAASPVPVTVPRNQYVATGAGNVPNITWSDWITFRTRTGSVRPQLLFRALLPPGLAILAFPGGPGIISGPTPDQPERLLAQAMVAGDYVTNPNQPLPLATPVPHTPIYVVQYRAATPGTQIVIGGDSHLAMSNTFPQLAATALSTPAAPISVWNTAWGGQASKTFWPCLDQAIDLAQPSITVIQGWTANDGMNPTADEAYLFRVRESAARTIAAGGIPIIIKGLPRHLNGMPELASWQIINRQLDTLIPGVPVYDAPRYVEDPNAPGNWIAGLSDDGIHPNMWGNFKLCTAFQTLLASLSS